MTRTATDLTPHPATPDTAETSLATRGDLHERSHPEALSPTASPLVDFEDEEDWDTDDDLLFVECDEEEDDVHPDSEGVTRRYDPLFPDASAYWPAPPARIVLDEEDDASDRPTASYLSRPKEEHFFTVAELHEHLDARLQGTLTTRAPLGALEVKAGNGELHLDLRGENRPIQLNYLTLQHLCRRTGLTTRFLKQVSPEIAALALNESLSGHRDAREEVELRSMNHGAQTHSLVSKSLRPAWDAEIIERIAMPLAEQGWIVPPRSAGYGRKHPRARPARPDEVLTPVSGDCGAVRAGDLIRPEGARASDRNIHLFLVHPERVLDTSGIMDRPVFRGLTLRHSETGDGALAVQGFLFDFVCGNYMMYGAREVFSLWMPHRRKAWTSETMVEEASEHMAYGLRRMGERERGLMSLARRSAKVLLSEHREVRLREVQMMLLSARLGRVFSTTFLREALALTHDGKYGDERSLWAVASGLTERAQVGIRYAEDRAIYDRAASKLLEWGARHA